MLTFIYGLLWGIAGSILMPPDNLLNQTLVIIVIIGVASGGLHILQASILASFLFFGLVFLPTCSWLFYQNTHASLLLGLTVLTYACFISLVSVTGHRIFNNNFKLRYENLDLIETLCSINASLEESELRFHSAFDSAAIGMALVSTQGRWLQVNESLCNIVGYSEEELLKIDFQTITHPDDLDLDLNNVQQLLDGKIRFYHIEKRYIHKNGDIIWILLSGSLIRDRKGKPLYCIAQITNIDAQKRAEKELYHIAYHDILTDLANRKQLATAFEHAKAYADRHNHYIAIMFLDLDDFKKTNDNLGHEIGDLLLVEIAKIIKNSVRSTDIVARQGGDEFIIMTTELSDLEPAITAAKKILASISRRICINQNEILITGSIGISLYPQDGQDLKTLIKQADNALYHVKNQGRNNFKFYDDGVIIRKLYRIDLDLI